MPRCWDYRHTPAHLAHSAPECIVQRSMKKCGADVSLFCDQQQEKQHDRVLCVVDIIMIHCQTVSKKDYKSKQKKAKLFGGGGRGGEDDSAIV